MSDNIVKNTEPVFRQPPTKIPLEDYEKYFDVINGIEDSHIITSKIPPPFSGSTLLTDSEITQLVKTDNMITPFVGESIKQDETGNKVISYGVSSYGYDVRCSNEFKIFTNTYSNLIDPKNFDIKNFVDHTGEYCIIPPNSFILTSSVEYFNIPDDVMVICLGKSTYARCGVIFNVTPLEPSWSGHITIELSNSTSIPVKIYANEGVGQLLFVKGNNKPSTTYKDRAGKYQNQTGITLPKM